MESLWPEEECCKIHILLIGSGNSIQEKRVGPVEAEICLPRDWGLTALLVLCKEKSLWGLLAGTTLPCDEYDSTWANWDWKKSCYAFLQRRTGHSPLEAAGSYPWVFLSFREIQKQIKIKLVVMTIFYPITHALLSVTNPMSWKVWSSESAAELRWEELLAVGNTVGCC